MNRFLRSLVTVAIFTAGIGITQANPLQRRLIPDDAVWWVHVDVDRLKQTEVGRVILGEMEKPEAEAKLAAFEAIFNFDPLQSLRACTLYGRGQASSDGVLLLEGAFDAERLLTLARAGEDFQSRPHGTHAIHSWIDKKRSSPGEDAPRSYGAIHPAGWVILGQSGTRVGEALDVLDGHLPSLARSDAFTQWAGKLEHPTILAAARRVEGLTGDPRAAFLKHSSQYSLALGEEGQAVFADALLVTDNEETAGQVLAIIQGLKALVGLTTQDPNAIKLAQGLSVSQQGSQVVLSLRLASSEVVEALREGIEQKNQ